MHYFTWCLLLLFEFTASEEISPNVTIIWEENVLSLKYRPPLLIENQPFKIIVKPSSFNARYDLSIMCYYNNKNVKIIDKPLIQKEGQYVNEVNQASVNMIKEWNCSIKQKMSAHLNNNPEPIIFSPHVRLTEMKGEMRVNDRNINLKVTDVSVSDYDAVGTYYYRDGELAKLTCHKTQAKGKYNFHSLFFSISDKQHKTGTGNEDVNVYLKLGHRFSPKYIDCVLVKLYPSLRTDKIRLMFIPLSDEIDYPQFQVNGLNLTPSKNYSDYNYVFVYEYYHGEDLTVKSNLDTNRFESMSCAGVNFTNDITLEPVEITELRFNIRTHQFAYPQASVDCLVKQRRNMPCVRICIKFIEDTMKFSPSITGIQWSETIAKFKDDLNRTYSEGTIYASYNSNDNMTLNCSFKSTGVKWNYDVKKRYKSFKVSCYSFPSSISDAITQELQEPNLPDTGVNSTLLTDSRTESKFSDTNEYISSRSFHLSENVNKTALKCIHYEILGYDKNTSKVVLIQEKKSTEETKRKGKSKNNSETNKNPYDNNFNSYYGGGDGSGNAEPSGRYFVPIIISVISIITIISIITLIVLICKKKKLPNTDSDINYENLPAHNEGSLPIPSQWDTNRFRNENAEEPYAKVIPKSQRTKVAGIYSEPLSKTEDASYATPYNADSESPYAEIIPISQRNENVPSASANIECYAQVVPKSLRNVAKNQVLPANDDVKNSDKLRNRADSDKHKYANVFNSKVYANVNSSGC